jgi:hypothetical protein
MLDFRVPFSLELKTPEMHFLKVQKKRKIHPKNTSKKGVQKPPKKLKTPVKQGLWEQRRKNPGRGKCPKTDSKDPYIWAPKTPKQGRRAS